MTGKAMKTGGALLLAAALLAGGFLLREAATAGSRFLFGGVSDELQVAALRLRLSATDRENQNLRTEVAVRGAMQAFGRNSSGPEADRIVTSIIEAHQRYGLPIEVLLGVIRAESGFDTDVVSSRGAVGLMQVMPTTARELASDLDIDWTGEQMLLDPSVNIRLGSEYLHRMFEKFGAADSALAAYNAGPARLTALHSAGIRPRRYTERVLRDSAYAGLD